MDSKSFEWRPWKTFKPEDPRPPRLPIDEPPCKHCLFFYPIAKSAFDSDRKAFRSRGVTLCHAEEMFKDFSCFQKRADEDV